jgi:SAM-dependent methyltransferase
VPRATSAGDHDYDGRSVDYASVRRPDPRFAAAILAALGDARTVVNVGAGAGSYEPTDRYVAAVEPSSSMRMQRPAHVAPAIDATAEALPFDDDAFDAAMATVTVHQWSDVERGLGELRRVARGPVVILTFDPAAVGDFWLAHYAPEIAAIEGRRFPSLASIAAMLGGDVTIERLPIARDCTDGFAEAFYARPDRFLDADVRAAQSWWSFLASGAEERIVEHLRADLSSGEWNRRFGPAAARPTYDGCVRLVVAHPG